MVWGCRGKDCALRTWNMGVVKSRLSLRNDDSCVSVVAGLTFYRVIYTSFVYA